MCPCKSLRFVSGPHHHFRQIDGPGLLASRKGVATPLPEAANIASASQDGSMSAVALGDCLGSLSHRG
jgi:hypothetical protein